MKNGFTLVELSIALVIIGLLIGGILVGQSLIESAKINAAASQIQQFDAGIMAFKAKYKFLPGDAPGWGGDGGGGVGIGGDANNTTNFACEIANFWHSLSPQEYIGTVCQTQDWVTYDKPNIKGTSKNVPISKIGKADSFFIASALGTDGYQGSFPLTNYYSILASPQAQEPIVWGWYYFITTNIDNSAVKPSELLALDKKLDDGIANTGDVLSGGIADPFGAGVGGIVAEPGAGICSDGATYLAQNSGYECTPLIRIGAQAGGNPL